MSIAAEVATIAIALHARGFVRASRATLERGLGQHPDSGRLWELHGTLLYAEEAFDAAQAALETASLLTPLNVAAQFALAGCYLRAGHLQSAGVIYHHLHHNCQVPQRRYGELAQGFARTGALPQALSVCRAAAEREPDSDEAIFGMAHYMSRLAYPAEQILPLLQKAVDLAPDEPHYRLALVGWLARTGCNRLAHEHLQTLPDEVFAQVDCVCCLQRLMQVCQAVGDQSLYGVLVKRLDSATRPSC